MEWYWILNAVVGSWIALAGVGFLFIRGASTRGQVVALAPKVPNGRVRYRVAD